MSATNVARAGKRGNICVGNNVSSFASSFSQKSLACFSSVPEVTSLVPTQIPLCVAVNKEITSSNACRNARILSIDIIFFADEIRETSRFLPRQGFGPEAKTRGGIIVSPAYAYKKCVNIGVVGLQYANQSRFDETRRARWYLLIFPSASKAMLHG